MGFHGNWVDLVILGVLGIYVWEGWGRGIFTVLAEMGAFVTSIAAGLRFYKLPAMVLERNFQIRAPVARVIAFLVVAVVVEQVLGRWFKKLVRRIPKSYFPAWWQGLLTIVPSLLTGLIVVGLVLVTVMGLPVTAAVKRDTRESEMGKVLLKQAVGWEQKLSSWLGKEIFEGLTFMTVRPEARERLSLPVERRELKVDEMGEAESFRLVNQERMRAGRQILEWRPELVPVARMHAQDMLRRGYFGHYSPEGKDVGKRLNEAGVSFLVAGENLALAPTIEVAHEGLMGSEGHRRNILAEEFGMMGVGVVDGGVYGKMIVQIFTD
ncbi:MAG: CvpA family protein [Candidatus Chisholmbacteria bacterium]|nr:CvpA family protein [Candidatus Chisholmbacteria bacterium]